MSDRIPIIQTSQGKHDMEITFITSSFLFVIIFLHEGGRLFVIPAICEFTLSEVKTDERSTHEVKVDERLNHASFLQVSRYVCETNLCK